MKVMLVDDEPLMLKILARQLNALGYRDLLLCEKAQDALAALRSDAGACELIFLDLQMPGLDGVEFVRHLEAADYAGGLVLVSGEEQRIVQAAAKLARAHRLNVMGSLQKPVLSRDLAELMERQRGVASKPAGAAKRSYTADELREALHEKQFVSFYQPKIQLRSGEVWGVETLVRWQHPRDGLVFPDQFISTAEENGLINDLTDVVLEQSLRQAKAWQDAGLELRIAVNVSMENLTALNFPDRIIEAISVAGFPPDRLTLEVTESRLMRDPTAVIDILTRLRLKHIGLSIDDFGTGHSSLSQLRDIPFNELKVDRGFVYGAWHDASRRAILEASLGMARQLGMKTVAEGVEDRNDWDLLRALGCDIAQGYFVARPMPAVKFDEWMREWKARSADVVSPAA